MTNKRNKGAGPLFSKEEAKPYWDEAPDVEWEDCVCIGCDWEETCDWRYDLYNHHCTCADCLGAK